MNKKTVNLELYKDYMCRAGKYVVQDVEVVCHSYVSVTKLLSPGN